MIFLNNELITPTIFPDKTSQVWKINIPRSKSFAIIRWDFDHEGEIMHVAQLKELMDKEGIKCILHMPYMPYARQDKYVSNETSFARLSFFRMINLMGFFQVEAYDPHSSTTSSGGLDNFKPWKPYPEIESTIKQIMPEIICFPDDGARFRYYEENFKFDGKIIHAEKTRDQKTGKITGMKLITNKVKINNKLVLIVDDICDGGATFIKLAELLYKEKAFSVDLHVSHGIFSQGTNVLYNARINRIFTKKGLINERTSTQPNRLL